MKKYKVAIIGGGCSGLFLANLLTADNLDVYIFEKNNKLGKKILASGNGKCNFTNIGNLKDKYNDEFANRIIERFDVQKTLETFRKMGLIYKNDLQGRCYPVSECATSVLDALKINLSNVHILLEKEIKDIKVTSNGYCLDAFGKNDIFDYVVCCSGSAASNLGSFKAYEYMKNLDLKMIDCKSSLVPVKVKENVSKLKGLRVKCLAKLLDENNYVIYEEDGEVLFREDSLSGIAVFNISSYIRRKPQKYKIQLDLSLGMNYQELVRYFRSKKSNINNIFKGYLNDKLAEYVLTKNNIFSLTDENINKIINCLRNLFFEVSDLYPLEDGQVCSGGISLEEVKENLELKKYKNLYVSGEVLNVDGISGGYNMQFAWSCAGVIAEDIKRKINDRENKTI